MKQTKLTYTHDFTGPVAAVHVEVLGDDAAEVLDALFYIGERINKEMSWQGKPTLSDVAKPVKKSDAKKNPDLSNQQKLDEAMRKLAETYASPTLRDETKALLAKYGVKKFSEIPADKGAELLADADTLFAKLPAKEAAE